jgi:hypothetical protein
VASYSQALCSESFSKFIDDNNEHAEDLEKAVDYLRNVVCKKLAAELLLKPLSNKKADSCDEVLPDFYPGLICLLPNRETCALCR